MRNTQPRKIEAYRMQNGRVPFTMCKNLLARIQGDTAMREMKNWRESLIERLAADREEAIGFLQAVMEDYQIFGNPTAVVSAVQAVVESPYYKPGLPIISMLTDY